MAFPSHHWLHSLNAFQRIAFFRFRSGMGWHSKQTTMLWRDRAEEEKTMTTTTTTTSTSTKNAPIYPIANKYICTHERGVFEHKKKTITIIFIADILLFLFFPLLFFSAKLNFAPIALSHCLWLFLVCVRACFFLSFSFVCNGKKRATSIESKWFDWIFFCRSASSFLSICERVLCLSRLEPHTLYLQPFKGQELCCRKMTTRNTDDKYVCVCDKNSPKCVRRRGKFYAQLYIMARERV